MICEFIFKSVILCYVAYYKAKIFFIFFLSFIIQNVQENLLFMFISNLD